VDECKPLGMGLVGVQLCVVTAVCAALAISSDAAALLDFVTSPSTAPWELLVYCGQGLTLVHFSAQPEPFLTQNTPYTPLNTTENALNIP